MTKKLNSMRFLEHHNIPYEVFAFADSIHDAQEVAVFLGVPPHIVYKTLVVIPEDRPARPLLVLVGADRSLNLKSLAKSTGHKKVRMAAYKEAETLTGLKVGGISALALTVKNWPVYIDRRVIELEHMLVSAGQRGINPRVPVQDFIRILKVQVIDCSQTLEA